MCRDCWAYVAPRYQRRLLKVAKSPKRRADRHDDPAYEHAVDQAVISYRHGRRNPKRRGIVSHSPTRRPHPKAPVDLAGKPAVPSVS